jgi:type I restriction enzyme, R subunit
MITDINSEDRLVQETFADYLENKLGWENVYAWNKEVFGQNGTLGRFNEQQIILTRDLRTAIKGLNPALPEKAVGEAIQKFIRRDFSRSTLQHNQAFFKYIRDGIPISYRDKTGRLCRVQARVIDFRNPDSMNNTFKAVRELKIQGLRSPHYNRRADLVCFVNGIPLVFIELKAVYLNIRAGFDNNLNDYFDTIPHAFYHNAFLVVSNGDRARYGTITSEWEHFSEWKRNDEKDKGRLEATVLLDGMLKKERLFDLLENFVVYDDSKPGGTRKVLARNHQLLGVNHAVNSVWRQEELRRRFPPEKRLEYYEYHEPEALLAAEENQPGFTLQDESLPKKAVKISGLPMVKRAHPDLGLLGVFWHTQGAGKSYSMVFFAEKVRRFVPGNFTFVIMTDRKDLDDQIYRTFAGCGVVDEKTPRAGSGDRLEKLLKEDHRYIFSLIHKFNKSVSHENPYSKRDDIIVISDEAHRTQAGKLARNMRLALPNAAFIGFTGTPLFKYDHLTRRIFGNYVSRYDFKRSEEDGATVKLVYENRGEKLGLTRLNLNDRIADKIAEAELDQDQISLLEKLLGKDYEVITADDRLDKIADDFVEYCVTRWESGKSMLVCIDKLTCARMYQRILPRWNSKCEILKSELAQKQAVQDAATDEFSRERLKKETNRLRKQIAWVEQTIIEIIISEGQNEVRDFKKWDFDIRPHRELMKNGFETPDGKRVDVETAFKDPGHPFRIGIVCAMWLTGFDVECLSTLYIDKPMKAHTLMQAIARANRVFPGKTCGVIVDYNGMLKSLREAMAQYALGDDADNGNGGEEIVAPIEALLKGLIEAIEAAEQHLETLGFDPARLIGSKGFERIEALRDAVEALYTSDEAKRRFEIMAREIFSRFKALLMEPSVFQYAERHDHIETIYKKLGERRDTSDVTDVLKAIHRIVNQAIRANETGVDQAEGVTLDLSRIDFEKLREEFAKKVRRKKTVLEDIRKIVENKLEQMLSKNPLRMDFYKKYQEIISDYNREKDRATVEETFAKLADLTAAMDAEQRRAAEEGLSEDELALFDLLRTDNISKADRERLKQAGKGLLESLTALLEPIESWTEKEQTQAEVKVFILDNLFGALPDPPYGAEETERAANRIYDYVWQRSSMGNPLGAPVAA